MNDTQMDPNGTAFVPTGRPNNEHLWRLTRNLLDLQKSGKFCDVQLLCQDGSLSAHSVVLASACDSLHATIQHQHMHLPMMEYSLETVQRMVTYLYTGYIDPPPPHEEISFQNLMDSMGLPHTQPDDIEDLVSPSVYPVTSPARIDQDIKPQLVAGEPIEPNQLRKRLPKNLEPVVSLVQLNLDTFESDNEEEPDDEIPEINIKQEIESDDEPSTSLETQTPETQHFTNRGRKRKAVYDDDYDYAENDDRDYIPRQSSSSKRKSTPKRAYTAKARKSMGSRKPMNIDSIPKSEDPDEDADEQYGESFTEGESYVEGDSFGLAEQKPLVPKPKKKVVNRMCEYCGYQTTRRERLETHYLRIHGVPYKEQNARRVKNKKPKEYTCTFDGCDYKTLESEVLRSHIIQVHDATYYDKANPRSKDCNLVQCDICGAVVSRIAHHKKSQHNFKLVQCQYCDRMIKDINMTKHVKVKHLTGAQVFICPTCGYKCSDYHIFKFHCVTKHDDTSFGNVKVYTCEFCGLKSKGQYNLDVHIKAVHVGSKDVLCDVCGCAFRTKETMTSHRKTHFKDGEAESCPFESCNYTTAVEGYIKRHINIYHKDNKEWACDYCDYSCKQRGNLRLHFIRKHKISEEDASGLMERAQKIEMVDKQHKAV